MESISKKYININHSFLLNFDRFHLNFYEKPSIEDYLFSKKRNLESEEETVLKNSNNNIKLIFKRNELFGGMKFTPICKGFFKTNFKSEKSQIYNFYGIFI